MAGFRFRRPQASPIAVSMEPDSSELALLMMDDH